MAKATKRGSSWNIRVYDYTDEQGRTHHKSFTAPTKMEVELMASEYKANRVKKTKATPMNMTVGEAIDRYIELKALLSPTTLKAYKTMRQFAFPTLMNKKVSSLDDETVQLAINDECKRIGQKGVPLSAKSVKNEYALFSGAMKEVCHREFWVTLPKVQKHIKDIPEAEEVINAVVGTPIELPCLLSLWLSFSMSEIRGLMCSDVKDGYITINRVKVEDIVKDTAKVETRLRRHELPPYLMKLINDTSAYKEWLKSGKNGFLVPQNRKSIYSRWKRICEQNDLGDLSFHMLRHINCSVMASLGISEKVMQERGGWKSSHVPKTVYTHTFSSDRREADELVNRLFSEMLQKKLEQNPSQDF